MLSIAVFFNSDSASAACPPIPALCAVSKSRSESQSGYRTSFLDALVIVRGCFSASWSVRTFKLVLSANERRVNTARTTARPVLGVGPRIFWISVSVLDKYTTGLAWLSGRFQSSTQMTREWYELVSMVYFCKELRVAILVVALISF